MWKPEVLLAVLDAFWEPKDLSKELGLQAWVVLSYIVLRTNSRPVSIRDLAQTLRMRWSKMKGILGALEAEGFIVVTQVRQRVVIQIKEPKWIPEVDENPAP